MKRPLPFDDDQPRVEVLELGAAYEVLAKLPGTLVGDVDVSFEDGILRVCGIRAADRSDRSGAGLGFEIDLPFGDRVTGDGVRAVYAAGRLQVTLPKPND